MNLAPIAFANGVLLVGLYALGWAPATIAFLFWFEAAVVGAFTFVKVAASLPGEGAGAGKSLTYVRLPRPGGRTRVSSTVPRVNAILALPLFLAFYGLLLCAYGALLLSALRDPDYLAVAEAAVASDGVRWAMLLIVGGQLWSFWRDYVRGPAWQRADPTFHFWKPFGLAILAWLVFFVGFLLLGWLHSPLVVLTVLIVLKAVAELFAALVDAQAGEWRRVDPVA